MGKLNFTLILEVAIAIMLATIISKMLLPAIGISLFEAEN